GLNRFDGINFKVFRHNPNDSKSICSNSISALYCDQNNVLWVGTTKGLCRMEPGTNHFSKTKMTTQNSGSAPVDLYITSILEDSNHKLYIGAYTNGLLKYDAGKDVFTTIPLKTPDGKTTKNYSVLAAAFDNQNRLFVGTSEYGLCILSNDGKITVLNEHIKTFFTIKFSNRLYIGNEKGLYCYNQRTNSIDKLLEIPGTNGGIHHLFTDNKGILWIATETDGIVLYDTKTGDIENIKSGYNQEALSSSSIYYIFQDQQQGFWVGTMRGGVEYWDPRKPQFHSIQNSLENTPSLNFVNTFVEVEKNVLWVGTDGSCIQQFDKTKMKYVESPELKKLNTFSGKAIICMIKDRDENIWIGSYGNGLTKYNFKSKHIEHYELNNQGLRSNYIWTIIESKKGIIWIGSLNSSYLMHYDKTSHRFITDLDSINGVVSLKETFDGKLIVGTFDGFWVYDPVSNKVKKHNLNLPVRAIHEDKNHSLWLGTEGGGLKMLNPGNTIINIDPEMKEIKSVNIMALQEDDRNNLWISTYNGLYCYSYKTKKAILYSKADGLQSNQFTYSSSLKSSDKWIFFGGINGITFFDPKLFQSQRQELNLHLVDIKIMNRSIGQDGSNYLFPNSITDVKEIVLPYNKAYINLEYIGISYSNPEKIEYSYILDGIEKNWNYVGNRREANYINLSPGRYTFRLKALSNEGVLNEQNKTVTITILPPFWKTWWAYLTYFIIMAVALIKYRDFAIKQIHAKKERELNQLKLSFFINVSHEFRTPLTLMLNPLERIQKSASMEEIHASANVVQQSAWKLLNLVNQLLDFRKIDLGKSRLYVKKIDLNKLTGQYTQMFEELSQEKQIELKFESFLTDMPIWIDPEKYEKIISNLLSNALKFTNNGGNVSVSVSKGSIMYPVKIFNFWRKAKFAECAEVRVTDTGVGLTKEDLQNIFERFYQVDHTKPGTGIGLNYTKNLVEMHGGQILIESEYKKGSTFIVKIPLDDSILKLDHVEIAKDNTLKNTNFVIEKEALLYDLRNMDYSILSDDTMPDRAQNQVILIVEDNKTLRKQIHDELADRYIVREAVNGAEGLEKAKKYMPDLIITDIMMPEMDGVEMCLRVKEDLDVCHIPVIMLTAKGTLENKIEGFEKGADEYLSKPFSMDLLKVRINNLIQSRDTLRKKYSASKIFTSAKDYTTNNLDEAFLEKATKLVLENIDEPDFSLVDFYAKLGMSRTTFFLKINSLTGQNPVNFIRTIRLKYAAKVLLENKSSVKDVSYKCGFS
ncbi:MAG TPA: two-component regulator propeller domain-containing protein, partial [Bacteroidales bacterium]